MAGDQEEGAARLSLRERKKLLTRRALIEAAEARFAERGFDNVTVAEIADAVNVAAKTVFVYFPTKEDLVFHGEDEVLRTLVEVIRNRPAGTTPLDATVDMLGRTMTASAIGAVGELERLHRTVGDNGNLLSRMRLMWERFELAVAAELAAETGEPEHSPRPRVAAAQIVMVYRMMASPEAMAHVRAQPRNRRRKAFDDWLGVAREMVGDGIGEYARRT
ncbi:TetR/AcrR family transcriptional regulator [Streptomyces sp. TS71-3]|uniref:TetR/AcrR family transcriptional regulator n=1 Tax=Streptomyces sp. TS71-3 TaxID=2733862 RepID=UPI001B29266B|nr:helix-turn-helix domain-containing protein [Streptomyces sp. TS71-3]GHJ42093.1 TetR family transcriptional regulator [Streptomyces sp. TS71-3]